MTRAFRSLARLLPFVLIPCAALQAQHQYTVGTSIDIVGGGDDNPRLNTLPQQLRRSDRLEPFYGAFPSITLDVAGARSAWNFAYAYGWNRTESATPLESETHSVSMAFTNRLSPRWSTSLRDSFSMSDDAQTFYALRGVLPTPEGLAYVFSPVAIDQTTRSNNVNLAIDRTIDAKSALSFSGNHSFINYATDVIRGLSDQQQISAGATYTRRTSERTSWNFGWYGGYYDFAQYQEKISQAVRLGMSTQVGPNTTLSWSAGASQVKNRGGSDSFASYEASASLGQEIRSNLFQLEFTQDNTTPSGLGSVSKNKRASLGFSRALGRSVNVFASASIFDSKAILDNTFNSRGGAATANVGFALTHWLSLQVGSQFQKYTKPVTYRFAQKRAFISLRYTFPNLLHSR